MNNSGQAFTSARIRQDAPPFILRVIYFFLFGWWFTGIWINAAWVLNLTIIGLPPGLWMINRVPQVLTLSPMTRMMETKISGGQIVEITTTGVPQHHWLLRALYFVLIGWWLSLIWSTVAWLLCAVIVGLPIGIWMLYRLPGVTPLMRR